MSQRMFLISRKNSKLYMLFLPLKNSAIHIFIHITQCNNLLNTYSASVLCSRDLVVLSQVVGLDRQKNE